MGEIDDFNKRVAGKKVVKIVQGGSLHSRTDDGGVALECGDEDGGDGEAVILLDDGSSICVWASEWGGMAWFPKE